MMVSITIINSILATVAFAIAVIGHSCELLEYDKAVLLLLIAIFLKVTSLSTSIK